MESGPALRGKNQKSDFGTKLLDFTNNFRIISYRICDLLGHDFGESQDHKPFIMLRSQGKFRIEGSGLIRVFSIPIEVENA